jgi:hypothetical protein
MKSKEQLKKMFEKEPGINKESLTDETGCYARIRTAHYGVELWRYRTSLHYGHDPREISAPADNFKTLTEFIIWVQKRS